MTQTIWNFLPKAEEAIIPTLNRLKAEGGYDKTVTYTKLLLKTANACAKFALPVNGRIINDKLKGLPDGFRLPFPEIAIEYPVDDFTTGNLIDAPQISRKRIVVAVEFPLSDIGESESKAPTGATHMILVSAIIEADQNGDVVWIPGWSIGSVFNSRTSDGGAFAGTAQAIPCELGERVAKATRDRGDSVSLSARQDIGHEVFAVLELCEALSCSNVRAEKVAAPSKLNAKRSKSGKAPLPDYHVLTISTHHGETESATRASVGDRRAIRQHLRRGHVRVYQSGLRIWVNSTIVGNAANGRINKSYQMTA